MKKVIIGDVTLYHGDAIEILPALGECADLVFTDPPYILSSGGNGDYADWHLSADYNNNGELVTCKITWSDFMPLLYNSMRGDSHCYTMCNDRHVEDMLCQAKTAKLRQHSLLIWEKGTATPNKHGMKCYEMIGLFFKGKEKYWNDCGQKNIIYVPQENYALHPTSKPVALCENYIRQSTQEGEMVLDPFCGVGSTLLAAIKSGRKAIGIELEEKWFNASVKRIEDFYNKPQQMQML